MELRRIVVEGGGEETEFDFENYQLGLFDAKIGHKWIDFELSGLDDSLETIKIDARMDVKGQLGAWIPSSDWTADGIFPQKTLRYSGMNNQGNLFIESKSWTFGEEATLIIRKDTEKEGLMNPVIKFSVLLRPIIEKEEKVKLTIHMSIDGEEFGVSEFDLTPGGPSEGGVMRMQSFYESFRSYGATKWTGQGNIVHPKQYLTLRGIKHIMDEYLEKNNQIKLGYIGTDTTENIRSLIRWLVETDYIERIEEIVLFITTDWDKEFLDSNPFEEEIKQVCQNCKIRIHELGDETVEIQKERKDCDILVLTYVAPWVEPSTKKNFIKLIQNTLGKKSYLLSVDPQKAIDSVRATISSEFNLDNLYKDSLELAVAKRTVTMENPSVEWTIWKKKE